MQSFLGDIKDKLFKGLDISFQTFWFLIGINLSGLAFHLKLEYAGKEYIKSKGHFLRLTQWNHKSIINIHPSLQFWNIVPLFRIIIGNKSSRWFEVEAIVFTTLYQKVSLVKITINWLLDW